MILLRFAVTMRNHCTPSTHADFIDEVHICNRVGVGMFMHPGNRHLPSPVKRTLFLETVITRDDIFLGGCIIKVILLQNLVSKDIFKK